MVPTEAVLVISPHAGRSRKLAHARHALDRETIVVAEELEIENLDRLPELLRTPDGTPRLVIAAGGDGTVGSVAGRLAGAENPLGILPLGTGNDFARSLDIPLNPRRAARLLGTGEISRVDLGRLTRPGEPPRYFAHAATVGLNVDFAKLATRASVRGRLGRLTYLAAAVYAVRERTTFTCTLEHDGVTDEMDLLQLSVISAPVVGGALGLTVRGLIPPSIGSTCSPSRTSRLRRCFAPGWFSCWASTVRFPAYGRCRPNVSGSAARTRSGCPSTVSSTGPSPGSSKRSPAPCA
jgi:diacylglycerol kinase family enzyme